MYTYRDNILWEFYCTFLHVISLVEKWKWSVLATTRCLQFVKFLEVILKLSCAYQHSIYSVMLQSIDFIQIWKIATFRNIKFVSYYISKCIELTLNVNPISGGYKSQMEMVLKYWLRTESIIGKRTSWMMWLATGSMNDT